jgi:hypothetical protein
VILTLAAAASGLAVSPAVPILAGRNASFAHRLIAAHNAERMVMRVPLMAWDPALATGAATYARQLAYSGTFAHSDRSARRGIGENLWMGTSRAFSLEQMVGTWISERQWFRQGIFPNVSRSGGWARVGHYSQIIWPTTTRVGCGLANGRGRDVLVCRYAPAGNIDGRRVP